MHLDWRVLGFASGVFLTISYSICVVYDLVFSQQMYEAWIRFLPGFSWISWQSFFVGLVETFLYGIYFGLVFAPVYNYFLRRLRVDR